VTGTRAGTDDRISEGEVSIMKISSNKITSGNYQGRQGNN
jgi:hypothetical protein